VITTELWHGFLQRARRALREAFAVPGFASVVGLGGRGRDREQCHGGNAQAGDRFRLADQLVDRHALDPGHRRNRHALCASFHHEHGVDQVIRCEHRLAHQAAREIVPAHPARPGPGYCWGDRRSLMDTPSAGRRRLRGRALGG
jgi:hypothetical protein